MFKLFNREPKDGLIRNQIELISVHIPKSAGTSFRNILKQVYGEQAVIRLDIDLMYQQLKINEAEFEGYQLDKKIKVVHGHFSPALLRAQFKIDDQIPMITWLRDPVERVISNYFYLEKRLKEELEEERKGLNILSKMQRSLMEYAGAEINRNRISKFLNGAQIKDFTFVGIQEHYSEDLRILASILGWNDFQELHHNQTGKTKREISPEDRAEIARLNPLDMALYQEAMELRSQGV